MLTSAVPRRRRRILLAALALLAIAGAIAWRLTEAAPSWYRPPSAHDPRIVQLADDVEYRIVEEVHRPRDEPFTIRLREEHANAWLATRLPRWVAGREWKWPSALGTPQVRFTANGIDLAGDIETATGRRYFTARLQPRVEGDQFFLAITSVSVGRVSLGSAPVDGLLAVLAPEKRVELMESEAGSMLLEALQGGTPIAAEIRLADGRRMRLRDVVLRGGSIDLTLAAVSDD